MRFSFDMGLFYLRFLRYRFWSSVFVGRVNGVVNFNGLKTELIIDRIFCLVVGLFFIFILKLKVSDFIFYLIFKVCLIGSWLRRRFFTDFVFSDSGIELMIFRELEIYFVKRNFFFESSVLSSFIRLMVSVSDGIDLR